MTQTFAEILLLVPSTLCTGFLIFIAGVIQRVMNDLDEATFHRFLKLLDKRAMRSLYAVGVSSITFVGMIPYWIFYGFDNWWFSAGLILYTVASIISKSFNLPIYKRIFALESSDTDRLSEERRKLQSANILRATIQFASIILMVIGFF
ncbi:MAG: hypothetical protein M0Q51_11930 [Bacteroidales bacterium]|nr:hypothetical protein [Bacteroidales bacterium]